MNPLLAYEPGASSTLPASLDAVDVVAAVGADFALFLGRGSFGETWRVGFSDGQERAVKFVLDPNYPPAVLAREVAGLQRVSDPRVVKLLAISTFSLAAGDRQALEFEFIDGGDAATMIAAGRWPDHAEVAAFVRELLGAATAMHATNTVHRDIKPGNVALRGGAWASPVLLDLGMAKQLDVESMTQYPAFMGTAAFMAPEQLRAEKARKQADVWAIGVVGHLLLARQHPFLSDRTNPMTLDDALQAMEAGPRPLPATVPTGLGAVVTRLLSFEPHVRGSAARAYEEMGRLP